MLYPFTAPCCYREKWAPAPRWHVRDGDQGHSRVAWDCEHELPSSVSFKHESCLADRNTSSRPEIVVPKSHMPPRLRGGE